MYVESLLLRLLTILVTKPLPGSVKDVKNKVTKTFPPPIVRLADPSVSQISFWRGLPRNDGGSRASIVYGTFFQGKNVYLDVFSVCACPVTNTTFEVMMVLRVLLS